MRFLAGVLALLLPALSAAAGIETLVMPGALVQGHAKYEQDCNKCHEPFSKTRQNALCSDCHKEVGADIDGARGYHGRIPNARAAECKSCHTDHKGRGADIVPFDRDTFDHAASDFPLKGAHRRLACQQCHAPQKKFREAAAQCLDCHERHDPHKGRLGKACADCHTQQGWKEAPFDHDKTAFRLQGRHREANCADCHPQQRYKQIATQCSACHGLKDVHGGRYGAKCQDCHDVRDWKPARFDHTRDTKYRLLGRHAKVACDACHRGPLYGAKLADTCHGCHEHDDVHQGRYTTKCEDCHGNDAWRPARFDHDKDTQYALRGRHQQVACQICHRGRVDVDTLKTDCFSCHRQDDVHREEQGRTCERCHDVRGWTAQVRFEHDITRFPLLGLHAVAACEECHPSAPFKGVSRVCNDCHAQRDEHKGRLGEDCAQCHNPNGWGWWRFDHDTQSDYRLEGKHSGLSCIACHQEKVSGRIELASACDDCHRADDVHGGEFGRDCARCHNSEAFDQIEIGRTAQRRVQQ